MVGPLIRTEQTVRVRMRQAVVAVALPGCAAIVVHGWHGATLLAVSIAVALVCERACRGASSSEPSAVITGAVFALMLPAGAAGWLAAAGAGIAIGLGKHAFGGLGRNPLNPTALALVLAMAWWPEHFFSSGPRADGVTAASPLSTTAAAVPPDWLDLALGIHSGSLAESWPPAVLAGGVLLLAWRAADARIPLAYLATVAWAALVLPAGNRIAGHAPWLESAPITHLLSGGTLFTAFFLLTDPVTAPQSPGGRILFAGLAGIYTMMVRLYSPYPDGAAMAVLLANLSAPLLDRILLGRAPNGEPPVGASRWQSAGP